LIAIFFYNVDIIRASAWSKTWHVLGACQRSHQNWIRWDRCNFRLCCILETSVPVCGL